MEDLLRMTPKKIHQTGSVKQFAMGLRVGDQQNKDPINVDRMSVSLSLSTTATFSIIQAGKTWYLYEKYKSKQNMHIRLFRGDGLDLEMAVHRKST